MVDIEVGMEKQYFAVDADMVEALAGIGITVSDAHALSDRDAARCVSHHSGALRQRDGERTNTPAPRR